jgi:hypothetical protein
MAVKISRILTFLDNKELPYSPELEEAMNIADDFELNLIKNDKMIAFTIENFREPTLKKTLNLFFNDKETAFNFLLSLMSNQNIIETHLNVIKYRLDNNVTVEWTVDFNYPL